MNIIQKHINNDQYYSDVITKSIIVIHHTAGGPNPYNVLHGWNFNPERVGTAYVIAGKPDKTMSYAEGDIIEAFEPKYWAHHLGCKTANNAELNKKSIAIEVCNWGQLIFKDGKYWNYVNKEVPSDEVISFAIPFRGFLHYHKYSDAQINSLRDLLKKLCADFSIPKIFHAEMFALNQKALNGDAGIYTHVSYRSDKNDCSPQPNLLQMLTQNGF